jgi:NAD(P)-dependent dehydrogenase (short-subunit alcohol dehydrogenase family)
MLKDRCALITGSTQGLGYAMAERLAAEGCNIVLNGFGDAQEIERKRRQLEQDHGVRTLHTAPTSRTPARSRRSSRRRSGASARSTS